METKYEAVFGDQALFEGAGLFTGIDIVTRNVNDLLYRTSKLADETSGSLKKNPIVAMRRIIRTPTWTVADKKAGRLPEVGCLVANSTGKISEIVAIKNGYFVMFECGKSNGPLTIHGDLLMGQFKPIETPEEKAARLREEWCSNALDSASILSGMREYDLKRLGGYIGNIYDALLSGELPVPVKGE